MRNPFSFLAGGASGVNRYRAHRARLKAWQKVAWQCGLKVEEISSPLAFRLNLQARGGALEVRIRETGGGASGALITVVIPGPPSFAAVRIRREHRRPGGGREIEIGEEVFDSTFFVEGPERPALVWLDAEVRALLLRANGLGELEIFRNEVRVDSTDEHLSKLLPLLLNLGWRLARDVEATECLAENAGSDPAPGVRLRNLLLLIREHPGERGTTEALRAGCADPSPQVRLRAAAALGPKGRDTLMELAESEEEDEVSAEAIAILGPELPGEHIQAILDQALRQRRLQTARACLEALGRDGAAPQSIETLAKVLALEMGELALVAAQALGATGNEEAEPPLILALQREGAEIRVAAANALSRVGTAAAVLPLKDATDHFPGDGDLRRASREAIIEIQTRLKGASPGQLSLAQVDVGQLSLVQDETGRLSLTDDPSREPRD